MKVKKILWSFWIFLHQYLEHWFVGKIISSHAQIWAKHASSCLLITNRRSNNNSLEFLVPQRRVTVFVAKRESRSFDWLASALWQISKQKRRIERSLHHTSIRSKMKIFSLFTVTAVEARRYKNGRSEGRQFIDCGGLTEFTNDITSLEISSPVDPNNITQYPPGAFCEWIFQDDCAEGFFIDPIRFDIEGKKKVPLFILWLRAFDDYLYIRT